MTTTLQDVVEHVVALESPSDDDPRAVSGAEVMRVTGGYSGHGVYRIAVDGAVACLKLINDAAIADREWSVLKGMRKANVDCVPMPLFRSGASGNAIVMTWCAGEPLGNKSLDDQQIAGLAQALRSFGGAPIDLFPPAGNFEVQVVGRARELWAAALSEERMQAEFASLIEPVSARLSESRFDDLMKTGTLWVGRGDSNLANVLWNGSVTFVDFEHGGYNDRVIELADLVEHPQSAACSEEVWKSLWVHLALDESEVARIQLARFVYAVFWFGMYLTNDLAKQLNPPSRANEQASMLERYLERL